MNRDDPRIDHWNYRLIRYADGLQDELVLREVYYDADGKPVAYAETGEFSGETRQEVSQALANAFTGAQSTPIAVTEFDDTDAGSADARLLTAVALVAGALWLAYLAPLLAVLVFIPAAVSAVLVWVLLARAERRERRPVRPLTRAEREAWERIRGEGL